MKPEQIISAMLEESKHGEGREAVIRDVQPSDIGVELSIRCDECHEAINEETTADKSEFDAGVSTVRNILVDSGWFFLHATNSFRCESCSANAKRRQDVMSIFLKVAKMVESPEFWEQMIESASTSIPNNTLHNMRDMDGPALIKTLISSIKP